MPQPFDYRVPQADVSNYFRAMSAGREDRLAVQSEERQSALSKYLPGALQGDKAQQQQALASGSPDQQINMAQMFQTMGDREKAQTAEALKKSAQVLNGVKNSANPQAALEQAKPILAQMGVPPEQIAGFTLDKIDSVIASATTLSEQFDQQFKNKSYALDQSRTQAQNAASYASADASRASAEYTRAGKAAGVAGAKPLPQRLQTAENDMLEKVQIASNNNTDVQGIIGQIDGGQFDPGLLKNKYDQAKSFLGAVDPADVNTRNYNSFITTMERLRNESLRLNKGVQTDSDAKRAWAELFQNINDKTIVRDQLARISMLNERAARQHAGLVRNQRKNYFGAAYEEPDWEGLGVDATLFEERKPATSFVRGGAGVFDQGQAGKTVAPPVAAPSGWTIKKIR